LSNFTFRYRLNLSPRSRIGLETVSWKTPLGRGEPEAVLASPDGETPISASDRLVFKSEGWSSEDEAASAGRRCFPALALTLARLRVGADYGDRAPKGGFTEVGLGLLERQRGHRVLNDAHGLMVYGSEPAPVFAALGGVRPVATSPADRFEKHMHALMASAPQLRERDQLALVLFNSSFFQDGSDARFLLLMMSVEALLDLPARSDAAVAHVDALLTMTRGSEVLTRAEKDSMVGSLNWLKRESITQTGKTLAALRLGERKYSEKPAPRFFAYCYGLRSVLVHGGAPYPTRDEVGRTAAQLEVFAADLLTSQYLDLE
jgi:hypothetical protein